MTTPAAPDAEIDALFREELGRITAGWHAPERHLVVGARRRHFQPALAAAVAVLAAVALVVIGLAEHLAGAHSPRSTPAVSSQPAPSARSSPSPSDTTIAPPPAGVDLYWAPAATPSPPGVTQLIAYDWTGTQRGGLRLTTDVTNVEIVTPSPRGTRLLVQENSAYRVVDPSGALVGTLPGDVNHSVWSDDEATLCYAVGQPGSRTTPPFPSFLYTVRPGTTPRRVAGAGIGVFQGPAEVLGCSMHADRALVLTYPTETQPLSVLVVRLSTGSLLRTIPLPGVSSAAPGRWNVEASPDTRLLAVTDDSGAKTVVIDTSNGAALGDAPDTVVAFSSSGNLVVTPTAVVEWRTGRVVAAPPRCCQGVRVQPGTDTLIVAVGGKFNGLPPSPGPNADDSVLVEPTGLTRVLLRQDEVLWGPSR